MYLSRPRACGRFSPLLGWRVSEEGELLVRGGGVIERYWPDKRAIDEEGWLHTGDLAAVDGEGFVEIVVTNLIVLGGLARFLMFFMTGKKEGNDFAWGREH